MDNNTITKEQVLAALNDAPLFDSKEQEFIDNTALPEDVARLVFAAYTKGVGMYIGKYFDEQNAREKAEKKYYQLAAKLVEKEYGI